MRRDRPLNGIHRISHDLLANTSEAELKFRASHRWHFSSRRPASGISDRVRSAHRPNELGFTPEHDIEAGIADISSDSHGALTIVYELGRAFSTQGRREMIYWLRFEMLSARRGQNNATQDFMVRALMSAQAAR